MVYYDCTEKKNWRPIPRSFKKDDSFKSTFVDRNRVSKLPMESRKPIIKKETYE